MAPVERNLVRRIRSGEAMTPADLSSIPLNTMVKVFERLQRLEARQGTVLYKSVQRQNSAA